MVDAALTLTAGDYFFYSIMGICVVFCTLVLLMGVIKILIALPLDGKAKATADSNTSGAAQASAQESTQPSSTAAATQATQALASGSAGEIKLHDVDPRDAAMAMAIVADELGKPINELRFISIKEKKKSLRAKAPRASSAQRRL